MTEPVGVVGAGTMGAGIAQVAAVAGRRVLVADAVPGAAERAIAKIRDRVKAQVEKGRLDADPAALDLTAVEIAGLHRELAANDPLAGAGSYRSGTAADRNVILALPAPFPL